MSEISGPAGPTNTKTCNDAFADTKTAWQDKWLRLERVHPEVLMLMDDVQEFASRWYRNLRKGPTLLVISGRNGCGKTHAALALSGWARVVAMTVCERGYWTKPPPIWVAGWSTIAAVEIGSYAWDDCVTADLLILDDIGAETDRYRSAEPTKNLGDLLGAREGKFTVVTTHVAPNKWSKRWDARVADRLLRRSKIVRMENCPSYWLVKQQKQ